MPNLYDLMTPEDRETMKKWAAQRKNPKYKQDIPSALYLCAQLGFYYGWQAVVDYRRGYHVGVDENGKLTRLAFDDELAVGMIHAAEKLHYKLKLDEGRINGASIMSENDKNYARKNADYVNRIAKEVNSTNK